MQQVSHGALQQRGYRSCASTRAGGVRALTDEERARAAGPRELRGDCVQSERSRVWCWCVRDSLSLLAAHVSRLHRSHSAALSCVCCCLSASCCCDRQPAAASLPRTKIDHAAGYQPTQGGAQGSGQSDTARRQRASERPSESSESCCCCEVARERARARPWNSELQGFTQERAIVPTPNVEQRLPGPRSSHHRRHTDRRPPARSNGSRRREAALASPDAASTRADEETTWT